MSTETQNILPELLSNVSKSVAFFEELLAIPQESVPVSIRNKAFLRRLHICFIGLYEYLCEKVVLPQEYREKPLDEIIDFFISKQVLTADDKEAFLLLGSVYTAIRWAKPGSAPDEDKIMEHLDELFSLIKRVVEYHQAQMPTEQPAQKEATP